MPRTQISPLISRRQRKCAGAGFRGILIFAGEKSETIPLFFTFFATFSSWCRLASAVFVFSFPSRTPVGTGNFPGSPTGRAPQNFLQFGLRNLHMRNLTSRLPSTRRRKNGRRLRVWSGREETQLPHPHASLCFASLFSLPPCRLPRNYLAALGDYCSSSVGWALSLTPSPQFRKCLFFFYYGDF